jgi:hypothetical protein
MRALSATKVRNLKSCTHRELFKTYALASVLSDSINSQFRCFAFAKADLSRSAAPVRLVLPGRLTNTLVPVPHSVKPDPYSLRRRNLHLRR